MKGLGGFRKSSVPIVKLDNPSERGNVLGPIGELDVSWTEEAIPRSGHIFSTGLSAEVNTLQERYGVRRGIVSSGSLLPLHAQGKQPGGSMGTSKHETGEMHGGQAPWRVC